MVLVKIYQFVLAWMLLKELPDNRHTAIRTAIVHYNQVEFLHSLVQYRLQGFLNVSLRIVHADGKR